jgi:hypothetical protein
VTRAGKLGTKLEVTRNQSTQHALVTSYC